MKNGAAPDNRLFLTVKEAAAYICVNPLTMYALARTPQDKGGPPTRRFGKQLIRFPRQQFIQWAEDTRGKQINV